jgi:citrate lyase subunit beta/citryl-CoA lyase
VNRTVSGAYDVDDLRAVVVPGLEGVRVPKAENAAEIAALSEVVEAAESESGVAPGSVRLYPIVESALGVLGVGEIARACPRVVRFCFGSTDFLGDIGAGGSDSHDPTLVARSTIVLHGRAAGCAPPVDSVYTTVADLDGLRAEAIWARDLGFFGKSVIHPCQIAPVHEVFSPSPDAVATAQSIVDAFADAGEGAIVVDGLFVDAAVAARAHALLRAARREDER